MRDDTILTAIDEAVGASARCDCGSELLIAEHGDALWLECPIFSSASRLPARLALFLREATHSRRIVAALPLAPSAAPVVAGQPVAATRPVVVRS
jgi:hypothetical protein